MSTTTTTTTATQRRKARTPARKHGTPPLPPAPLAKPPGHNAPRWFLGADNDGHSYIVPVTSRAEWTEWLALPSDDDRAWSPPLNVRQIDGPHTLTFTDPREETL